MKLASALPTGLVLLLALSLLPGPLSPVRGANAGPTGTMVCSSAGTPTQDGAITPGEYSDNYFDAATDLLVYVGCGNANDRPLYVGLVSPWDGWVGILVQASDVWDGKVNEVRISANLSSGAVSVSDDYGNATAGTTAPDVTLGGTVDVGSATARALNASRVFEFVVPLNSTDPNDSQLDTSGPFNFALEYSAYDADLQMPATAVSELHSLTTGAAAAGAAWTSVELTAGLTSASAGTTDFLVTLRDQGGYPVPSATVEIYVRTAFGMYDAGPVVTNEQGVGEAAYTPRDGGTFVLGAAYAGTDGRLASVAWSDLSVGSAGGSGPLGAGLFDGSNPALRPVEAIVVVIVLGVWATYAYAFFVTWNSMRRSPAPLHDQAAYTAPWREKK